MERMLIITVIFTISIFGDWELSSRNLEKMIKNSDVIVEGKFTSKSKIKVSDAIKGPQKLRRIKLKKQVTDIALKRDYILFFKLVDDEFSLIKENTIKSDVMIQSRIREQVMQQRVEASVAVVNAKVLETRDVVVSTKKKYTVATCEVIKYYKGECSKIFEVMYRSDREKNAKRIFLFPKLTYVFFLQDRAHRSTINPWNISDFSGFSQALLKETQIAKHIRNSLSKRALKILSVASKANDPKLPKMFCEELNTTLYKKNMYVSVLTDIDVPKDWDRKAPENIAKINCLIFEKYFGKYLNAKINYFSAPSFDGAIVDRHYVIKEVTKASSVRSRFEDRAGKMQKGLKIFGQSAGQSFSADQPVAVNLLIQNLSKAPITVCNSHIPYLLGVNIVNVDKNKLVLEDGLKPFRKMQKSFVKLEPNRYIVIPTLNLRDYCDLPAGKYGIYVQLYVPVSYAREKSDAWFGKILTNFIEFEIK
ncbi:hypothetical protein [Candidatus Uabimicrobium amorphum]|uniref:Uncharacterized protein n=1 Tax=Uabimicrobium amorphum TaxID=2596890 RepID=A0A5S9F192_UABAM|nr:hypothetical protein [Candidatus Uabimicrobium amorphum]BBM81961.1 hypothetical protein UABAM_00304 [Candidatus Uabimicrobium amorphum]